MERKDTAIGNPVRPAHRDHHTAGNADRQPGQETLATQNTTINPNLHSRQSGGRNTKYTTVTAVVWIDYGPTPSLYKWFQGHKELGSEKRTGWPAPGRTPAILGVPDQPRELCKRLDAVVLTTVFPSTPESMTQVRLSPQMLPLRRTRMGVPGKRKNLSHGTSPQVSSTGRMTSVGLY
ncbi:hypothetical protein Taro_000554 [Colocasia esculenta]|uniref:Uncharacterized protein n=1 Tax=Colocasia esculenta TaxID=4460 RepID=A0A843TB27_COLES|nr:hypothetical protein [Colocasia esculenta]